MDGEGGKGEKRGVEGGESGRKGRGKRVMEGRGVLAAKVSIATSIATPFNPLLSLNIHFCFTILFCLLVFPLSFLLPHCLSFF